MNKALTSLAALALLTACGPSEAPQAPPPPEVQVVALKRQSVQLEKDFVGQVYGYRDIPIRTRVEGFLDGIHFAEGRAVTKGQLLYTIDPEPLEAALTVAKSDQARAEVTLVRASSDLDRMNPLAEINAVSQRDLDATVAEKGATSAMLDAAKANVRINEIRLEYTRIKSPIDGIIGKSLAKEGEFVGRSPNPVILNTISSIDSIRVEFFLTEKDYLAFAADFAAKAAQGQGPQRLPLRLILADGELFPHEGRVDFVNREVDAATGTLLVQATFPNPGRVVRPGQFARVRAVVETVDDGLLVPQRCVTEFQGTHSVLVVNAEGDVEQRMVQLGGAYRDYFLVAGGLNEGETVVLEGLQKTKNGGKVQPRQVEFTSKYKGD
jgi:membrane fusion protein, multidrug efflux system